MSEELPQKTWADVVAPIRQTLDVAAMLGRKAIYEPAGAKALSELLERMALGLDTAVTLLQEKDIALERKDALLEKSIRLLEGKDA